MTESDDISLMDRKVSRVINRFALVVVGCALLVVGIILGMLAYSLLTLFAQVVSG